MAVTSCSLPWMGWVFPNTWKGWDGDGILNLNWGRFGVETGSDLPALMPLVCYFKNPYVLFISFFFLPSPASLSRTHKETKLSANQVSRPPQNQTPSTFTAASFFTNKQTSMTSLSPDKKSSTASASSHRPSQVIFFREDRNSLDLVMWAFWLVFLYCGWLCKYRNSSLGLY